MAPPEARNESCRNDGRLVRAVLDGNVAMYGELYDRYVVLIHAVCHDVTDDFNEVQDLAHDVFLTAYLRLAQLKHPERFGSWLLAIARNRCRDACRQRSRSRLRYMGLAPGPDDAPAPSRHENPAFTELRRAIAKLPERQRVALHLFYLEEKSAEHARHLLGLSRSGFYRVLERARRRLTRLMASDKETHR